VLVGATVAVAPGDELEALFEFDYRKFLQYRLIRQCVLFVLVFHVCLPFPHLPCV